MKKSELMKILNNESNVPLDAELDLDLSEYIEDSIDLGEVLAVLNNQTGKSISLSEFRNKRTLGEFISVVSEHIEIE